MICRGETTTISVQNPNLSVRGEWMYDLVVTADPPVTGYTTGGHYNVPTNLNETLSNSDTKIHKVVYRFIPRIKPDDGGSDCINGIEKTITVWVYPRLDYSKEISDFNGYNVSCYGSSNGYIKLKTSNELDPLTFDWTGPIGFTASTEDISGLIAGQYSLIITDKNMCNTRDSVKMIEPGKMSMTIDPSLSNDGAYNINCADEKTGSVTVTPSQWCWTDQIFVG